MKLKYKILITLTLILFIACKKEETISPIDKQVRLEFSSLGDFYTHDTVWTMPFFITHQLIKFNKHDYNYNRVKSIIFSPSMRTEDENVSCYIDLYNVTDSVPIAGTLLVTNDKTYRFVESMDIKDFLPNKEITLSLRIRSQRRGTFVSTGIKNYIFINRE